MSTCQLSLPLCHRAGSLCCFTCLNICFMEMIHVTDIYVIYLFVWIQSFPQLLPGPVFSPYHPYSMLTPYTLPC